MTEKTLNLSDTVNISDKAEISYIAERIKAGPKKTKITFFDDNTGEKIGEYENKVLFTGSILSAKKDFGVEEPVYLPNYNTEMDLENTLDYTTVDPSNPPIICLFCVGDSGCGTEPKDVYAVGYKDRIAPVNDIMPFRYVDPDDDLNSDLRKYYFGRKIMDDGKIAYYFKAFETTPQMHLRYTDGTEITEDFYNISTDQPVECYVETRLKITRQDFRDYFEYVRGWENARVSTLSLCYAWYDDTIDEYKWFQEIYPYTKLNFPVEWLTDLNRAISIHYSIFY